MTSKPIFTALALVVLSQAALASTPDDSVRLAAKDIQGIPLESRNLTRYVSTYNFPEDERDGVGKAVAFTVNSVSRNKRLVVPVWVDKEKTLLRINLGAYGIDAKVYDRLEDDPYFSTRRNGKKDGPLKDLMKETLSNAPVVRADYLVNRALAAPFYYQLLGVKDRDSFLEVTFTDEKAAAKARTNMAGVVVTSAFALNNRSITRTPSLIGYYYESKDVNTSVGSKNFLKRLFDAECDEMSALGNLPNGLIAYAVFDKEGKTLNSMDVDIALDSKAAGLDKVVRNPKSCMNCHSQGPVDFTCEVRRLVKDKDFSLKLPDAKTANRFADLFSTDFSAVILKDQKAYAEALKAVNGLDGEKNAALVIGLYEGYESRLKSQAVMARELGCNITQLKRAIGLYNDATFLGVLRDRPVRRDQFAESFQDLYAIVHDK